MRYRSFDSVYDGSDANLTLTLSAATPLSGELRVTGYTRGVCFEAPVGRGGGAASGGCTGATPTELARAQISAAP
jgi:hypothetical protein